MNNLSKNYHKCNKNFKTKDSISTRQRYKYLLVIVQLRN